MGRRRKVGLEKKLDKGEKEKELGKEKDIGTTVKDDREQGMA